MLDTLCASHLSKEVLPLQELPKCDMSVFHVHPEMTHTIVTSRRLLGQWWENLEMCSPLMLALPEVRP